MVSLLKELSLGLKEGKWIPSQMIHVICSAQLLSAFDLRVPESKLCTACRTLSSPAWNIYMFVERGWLHGIVNICSGFVLRALMALYSWDSTLFCLKNVYLFYVLFYKNKKKCDTICFFSIFICLFHVKSVTKFMLRPGPYALTAWRAGLAVGWWHLWVSF